MAVFFLKNLICRHLHSLHIPPSLYVKKLNGCLESFALHLLSNNGIRRLMETWDCSNFIHSEFSSIMALSLSDTSLMRQSDHTSLRLQATIKRFRIFKIQNHFFIELIIYLFIEKLSKKEAISSVHTLACKLPAVRMGIDMLLRYLDRLLEREAIRVLKMWFQPDPRHTVKDRVRAEKAAFLMMTPSFTANQQM